MNNQQTNSTQPIVFHPIGVIHSPHKRAEETPIQPTYAQGIAATAEIFPEYVDGLRDLEGFSHIYLIYHLHKVKSVQMVVQPFLEDVDRGIFATRSPRRPNPIGISIVRLVRVENNILHLTDIDVLDGTPLLDIKPYIPRFDPRESVRGGWQDGIDEKTARIRGRRQYRKDSKREKT
jgi:tRNA-Thr(GGU) m(6)t(6)A37 methyltransferase TsaA